MIRPSAWPVVLMLAGCSAASSTPPPVHRTAPAEPDTPAPVRDTLMLADAGPIRAALTAHFANPANGLDLFFETADRDPQPHALAIPTIVAQVRRAGDPTERLLTFEPAPADKRPAGEGSAACSHFVSQAAWLAQDDVLSLTIEIAVDGNKCVVTWVDFVPGRFAHPDDAARQPPAP